MLSLSQSSSTVSPPRLFPIAAGAVPILGHFPALYRDAPGLLARAEAMHGPLVWINLGFGRWRLFCFGVESLELLKNKHVTIEGAYEDMRHIAGQSFFSEDGAAHRQARSALHPPFTPSMLGKTKVGQVTADWIHKLVRMWLVRGGLDPMQEMTNLALGNVFRVMGIGVDDLPSWSRHYADYAAGMYPVPAWIPFSPRRRCLRANDWLDAELRKMVECSLASQREPTFFDALVEAWTGGEEDRVDQRLLDHLKVIIFAGHETTSSTLTELLLTLASEPKHWNALIEEVERFGAEVPVTFAEAKAYAYAEALFREAVRMYSPVWFLFRKTTAPLKFLGREIPTGTSLSLHPSGIGYRPELYPKPELFDPTRWLERTKPVTPLETAAFGGGAHFCLGYHLAWLESVQLLVTLAREAKARGVRLELSGEPPGRVHFPLSRPDRECWIALA